MNQPSRVKATPTTFRGQLCIDLSVAKSHVYVPLDQLREVADLLHDNADIYEEFQENGKVPA